MAEKDFYEKKLEDFNDVFADVVNVLLFGGERRVLEEDLERGMARSAYRASGGFREQERDAMKFWKAGGLRIALFGFENQTDEDAEYVFRGIGYDGAEYREQVRMRRKAVAENRERRERGLEPLPVPGFYPVVTLLLYFGDRRWKGSLNLKDHLAIPEGLAPYVPDYRVNLFEIAYLAPEVVAKFESDFRYVAEYFVQTRRIKEGMEPVFALTLDHIRHIEEFSELMSALTNIDRFRDLPMVLEQRRKEGMMTNLIDLYEERGMKKGIAQGKAQGENMFKKLTHILLSEKRYAELERATGDEAYKEELYRDYGIA